MLKETDCFQHIYIRTGYTDLRLGIDGLAAVIREDLGRNPFEENTLYLFCGRRTDRIKGLVYEGDGFLLLYKRIAIGHFQWPRHEEEARELLKETLSLLLEGFSVEKRSGNSHRTGSEVKMSTSGKRSVHKFPKSRKTA